MNENLTGVDVSVTETSPTFALGTNVAKDGKVYTYVQASGALSQYDAVIIDEAGQAVTASLTTSASAFGDRVGVIAVDFADNDYGWAQVYGVATVNVLANCAANAVLNTTGTAGQLDDDQGVGSEDVDGIVLTTAAGGSAASVAAFINWAAVGATN